MPNYTEVKAKHRAIEPNKYNEIDTKAKIVGTPLKFLGEILFKNLLSYTIGFQWVFDLGHKLDLPAKTIELPTVGYICYRYSDLLKTLTTGHIRRDLPDHMVSAFVWSRNSYKVTPLNFLFVPFHYLSRTLGKILGYTLASPFTVPAYLIIKATYKIKDALLHRAYKKSLRQMDSSSLIGDWIKDTSLPLEDIAKRITVDSLWDSHKRAGNCSRLTLEVIKEYANTRNRFLERIKPLGLTASRRKIRVEIETEQRLLASISNSESLNSIAQLMPQYETIQNIGTLLAVNTQAHPTDNPFADSIDPRLPQSLAFSNAAPSKPDAVAEAQKLGGARQVNTSAQRLAQSMMSQGGPLSNQEPEDKPEIPENSLNGYALASTL